MTSDTGQEYGSGMASISTWFDRRGFLARAARGIGLGAGTGLGLSLGGSSAAAPAQTAPGDLSDWAAVRAEFQLDPARIHMALMLLTSHPRPVREAIERHRRGLDDNPVEYFEARFGRQDQEVRKAAARYMGGNADEIALTDSTTMGLAVLYGGLALGANQEVLTSTHDHYATHENLRLRMVRAGAPATASPRKIALYDRPDEASEDEIVARVTRAISPRTKVVALTWVHSSTGVKLPIRAIADSIAATNRKRREADQILLCVDGVHGFGVESEKPADLACDFFVAGCHKWIFGPRGTGVLWGRTSAWKGHVGLIAPFENAPYTAWMKGTTPAGPPGLMATPGGFHSFEHRWSLGEAFDFHERIGRPRITARIRELARQCKEGLARMPHVEVHTPMSERLSAGLVCFEVRNMPATEVVKRLLARKIIASVTPYATAYARLSPGLLNTPDQIEAVLREIRGFG
jgi:isopenicillin-N epimerase